MEENVAETSGGTSKVGSTENQQADKLTLETNKLLRAVTTWITGNYEVQPEEIEAKLRQYKNREAAQHESHADWCALLTLVQEKMNNVVMKDERGRTILHQFLQHYMWGTGNEIKMQNDVTLVKSLCEMGSPIMAADKKMVTPLDEAMMGKRLDLVDAMIRFSNNFKVTDRTGCGNTVLHVLFGIYTYDKSKKYNDTFFRIVDELLARGADLNQANDNGYTPVHFAVSSFHGKVLKELMARGANLKCRTRNGNDSLMHACKKVRGDFIHQVIKNLNWLLKQGLNVKFKNSRGWSPIHAASRKDCLFLVKALVAAGADVHAVTHSGINCLHLATISFDSELMRYYIKCRLPFNRRSIVHGLALMHMLFAPSEEDDDEKALKYLIKYKFDKSEEGDVTLLHSAAAIGRAKIVEKLMTRGADVHARDATHGYTPLHLAAMRCDFETVPELNKAGLSGGHSEHGTISFKFRGKQELTATGFNAGQTVLALLKAGADVNAKDHRGRTALHYAAGHTRINDVVVKLLEAGAHVDVVDLDGLLPLHNSMLSGNVSAMWYLLAYGADVNDIELPHRNVCNEIKGLGEPGSAINNYLVKLDAAGLCVNRVYDPYLRLGEGRAKFVAELERLKGCMLTQTVSLSKWMQMNWRMQYAIDEVSNGLIIGGEWHHYAIVVRGFRNRAINRNSLMEPAERAFARLVDDQWPKLCIECVLSFLNNATLRVLIESIVI